MEVNLGGLYYAPQTCLNVAPHCPTAPSKDPSSRSRRKSEKTRLVRQGGALLVARHAAHPLTLVFAHRGMLVQLAVRETKQSKRSKGKEVMLSAELMARPETSGWLVKKQGVQDLLYTPPHV